MTIDKLAKRSEDVALAGSTLIDPQQLAIIQANIELLETQVKKMLKPGQDYGRIAGMQKDTLFDSGAGTIRAVYNIYPDQEIILHEENSEGIRYVVKVKGIHRSTGQVVASGVGSASSGEIKYAYRWVNARELGNQPKEGLKTKLGYNNVTLYRIDNPDIPDLDNTLLKMAAKRAEVDMTLQLPGVSRVFTQDVGEKPQYGRQQRQQPQPPVDSTTGEILGDGAPPEAKASPEGQGVAPASESGPLVTPEAPPPMAAATQAQKMLLAERWRLRSDKPKKEALEELAQTIKARCAQEGLTGLTAGLAATMLEEMKAEAPKGEAQQ